MEMTWTTVKTPSGYGKAVKAHKTRPYFAPASLSMLAALFFSAAATAAAADAAAPKVLVEDFFMAT